MAGRMAWLKHWTDAISNPKLLRLDDAAHRVLMAMWELASISDERGVVKGYDWETLYRVSGARSGHAVTCRDQLVTSIGNGKKPLVREREDGAFELNDWEEWQGPQDVAAAERKRRQRDKEKKASRRDGRGRHAGQSRDVSRRVREELREEPTPPSPPSKADTVTGSISVPIQTPDPLAIECAQVFVDGLRSEEFRRGMNPTTIGLIDVQTIRIAITQHIEDRDIEAWKRRARFAVDSRENKRGASCGWLWRGDILAVALRLSQLVDGPVWSRDEKGAHAFKANTLGDE